MPDITIDDSSAPSIGVSGMFDGLISKLISIKFDWTKINPGQLKSAVSTFVSGWKTANLSLAEAFKPAVDAPLGLDDKAIDKIVEVENKGLDALILVANTQIDSMFHTTADGGTKIIFNARNWTGEDVDSFLANLSVKEGFSASPEAVAKLRENPGVLEALDRLSTRKQARVMGDPSILDKLIRFLVDWGPLFLRIASIFLVFI